MLRARREAAVGTVEGGPRVAGGRCRAGGRGAGPRARQRPHPHLLLSPDGPGAQGTRRGNAYRGGGQRSGRPGDPARVQPGWGYRGPSEPPGRGGTLRPRLVLPAAGDVDPRDPETEGAEPGGGEGDGRARRPRSAETKAQPPGRQARGLRPGGAARSPLPTPPAQGRGRLCARRAAAPAAASSALRARARQVRGLRAERGPHPSTGSGPPGPGGPSPDSRVGPRPGGSRPGRPRPLCRALSRPLHPGRQPEGWAGPQCARGGRGPRLAASVSLGVFCASRPAAPPRAPGTWSPRAQSAPPLLQRGFVPSNYGLWRPWHHDLDQGEE